MRIRTFALMAVSAVIIFLCINDCSGQLAFIRQGKIVVADLDGRDEHELEYWVSVQKVLWLNEQELLILQNGDLYISRLDQPGMPITLTHRGDIYQAAYCLGSNCLFYASGQKDNKEYKSRLVKMGFELPLLYEHQLCQGTTWIGAQMAASRRWLYATSQPQVGQAGLFRVEFDQQLLPRMDVFSLSSDQLPQVPVPGLAVDPDDSRLVFALAVEPDVRYQLMPMHIPGQRWSMVIRLPEEIQGCCLMPDDRLCFSVQDELGCYNLWLAESSDSPGKILLNKQLTKNGGHSPSAFWPDLLVR